MSHCYYFIWTDCSSLPDWQCTKCQIAYKKYRLLDTSKESPHYEAAGFHLLCLLIYILVISKKSALVEIVKPQQQLKAGRPVTRHLHTSKFADVESCEDRRIVAGVRVIITGKRGHTPFLTSLPFHFLLYLWQVFMGLSCLLPMLLFSGLKAHAILT